jgi:DNA modification methylase
MAEQVKKKDPALWEQAKSGAVSISSAYKTIKKKEQIEQRHIDCTAKTNAETKQAPPTIALCDCVEWLERQDASDLLITDPPYSTDVDDIDAFAAKWLPLALSKVKSTGRAYVCVGAYPNELAAYIKIAMPTQILVWTYRNTLGPSPSHGYKLNWQAILYYQMPEAPPLTCPVMTEQFSVQDINAPDGRLGDRYHAWQKPMQLAERLIRHSTKAGDSVIDPFACTGSFLLAASTLGRIAKGCDISAENISIAKSRGCINEK